MVKDGQFRLWPSHLHSSQGGSGEHAFSLSELGFLSLGTTGILGQILHYCRGYCALLDV